MTVQVLALLKKELKKWDSGPLAAWRDAIHGQYPQPCQPVSEASVPPVVAPSFLLEDNLFGLHELRLWTPEREGRALRGVN